MKRILILSISAFSLFFGCSSEESDDAPSMSGADANVMSGADAGAGGEADAGVEVDAEVPAAPTFTAAYKFTDYISRGPLEGAILSNTEGGESAESDAEGKASIELPENSLFELNVNIEGYYQYNIFGRSCDEECRWLEAGDYQSKIQQPLVSFDAGDLLADFVGIEQSDDRGFVIANVFCQQEERIGICSGVTIELDSEAEVTLCEDSNDPNGVGLVPGSNVTVDGGIVFANVVTGPGKVKITVPEGVEGCSIHPGDEEGTEIDIEVYGRQVSIVDFICRQSP